MGKMEESAIIELHSIPLTSLLFLFLFWSPDDLLSLLFILLSAASPGFMVRFIGVTQTDAHHAPSAIIHL